MRLFSVCVFLLAGCTAPKALDDDALRQASHKHWQRMQSDAQQVPVQLALEKAVALAMKNNLELRLRSLEVAVASGNRQLSNISMLPTLTAQAGYRARDKVAASSSQNIFTGDISLQSSASSERKSHTEALVASWSVLDFGLHYFRAKEYGTQALIAEEERRRIMQDISKDVIYAWWMAKGFDELQPDIVAVRAALSEALQQSEIIAERRLRDPVDILEYRKALFLIIKRLDRLVLEMNQARNDLARLLNLPAGLALALADAPTLEPELPDASLREWQVAALFYRSELRQAQYRLRITELQSKALWLELLPTLQLSHGGYWDSNRFLVHHNWQEFSGQVSWNLMRLAAAPSARKLRKLNEEVARERERAAATAVIAQVAVARNSQKHADHAFCISRNLRDVDDKRLSMLQVRQDSATLDRLSVIRAKVDNLLLRAEWVTDRAEWQRARAMMLVSVGVGLVPDGFSSDDPDVVSSELGAWWREGLKQRAYKAVEQSRELLGGDAPEAVTDSIGSDLCV